MGRLEWSMAAQTTQYSQKPYRLPVGPLLSLTCRSLAQKNKGSFLKAWCQSRRQPPGGFTAHTSSQQLAHIWESEVENIVMLECFRFCQTNMLSRRPGKLACFEVALRIASHSGRDARHHPISPWFLAGEQGTLRARFFRAEGSQRWVSG